MCLTTIRLSLIRILSANIVITMVVARSIIMANQLVIITTMTNPNRWISLLSRLILVSSWIKRITSKIILSLKSLLNRITRVRMCLIKIPGPIIKKRLMSSFYLILMKIIKSI